MSQVTFKFASILTPGKARQLEQWLSMVDRVAVVAVNEQASQIYIEYINGPPDPESIREMAGRMQVKVVIHP